MRICIYEDAEVLNLEPLTLTRPAFALRCGASTLRERQQRAFGTTEVGALVRPGLAEFTRVQFPELSVNEHEFQESAALFLVNARWLPPAGFAPDLSQPHIGLAGMHIAYVALPEYGGGEVDLESLPAWLSHWKKTLPAVTAGGMMAQHLWDLVDANPVALKQDAAWRAAQDPSLARRAEALDPAQMVVVGRPEQLLIAEDVEVEPFVVADTRNGPVLIDRGAKVHAFSRLEGPCYVGRDAWIMGAKLRGGTIGPGCRIGGEVEASIVQGNSNKYHDGFLGHSYVGEWVNLAAGTQTSDLRNDYGAVRVHVGDERITTGRHKIGSFIGDHTKTGLGALLNTGSSIGAFCNLLPSGSLLPSVVPSFCQVSYGQVQERQDLRQAFATGALVMRRRGQEWTDTHRDFFLWVYDQTAEGRRRVLRESEWRKLRRSV
ncbi:MAG: hypothetical protein L0215_13350 [Gemmataceae bacterium]|nr:hypothetical protein [Gemmataceae bacterium]